MSEVPCFIGLCEDVRLVCPFLGCLGASFTFSGRYLSKASLKHSRRYPLTRFQLGPIMSGVTETGLSNRASLFGVSFLPSLPSLVGISGHGRPSILVRISTRAS